MSLFMYEIKEFLIAYLLQNMKLRVCFTLVITETL